MMGELKRKDELTTADLASRAENKNQAVREDLANEKRAVDRATHPPHIDRAPNDPTEENKRANKK
jgi:hypothetical protein